MKLDISSTEMNRHQSQQYIKQQLKQNDKNIEYTVQNSEMIKEDEEEILSDKD